MKYFEDKRKTINGISLSLISYVKSIINEQDKTNEVLYKRSGLLDFISELNDCQKQILRMMKDVSSENCFAMYLIDFLWKILLIRIEYHLNDED